MNPAPINANRNPHHAQWWADWGDWFVNYRRHTYREMEREWKRIEVRFEALGDRCVNAIELALMKGMMRKAHHAVHTTGGVVLVLDMDGQGVGYHFEPVADAPQHPRQ